MHFKIGIKRFLGLGKKFFLLLIILMGSFLSVFAQNYIHYTTDNGLPSGKLYNAIQDKDGFILINSNDGLIRFDGTHFKLFDVDDGLTDNQIITSSKDKQGTVWLSPFNGTICTYKDGLLENATTNPFLEKIESQLDKKDFVIHGFSKSGLKVFFQFGLKKVFVVRKNSLSVFEMKTIVRGILEHDNKFFVTTISDSPAFNYEIVCLNKDGQQIGKQYSNFAIYDIYPDKDSYYIIENFGSAMYKFKIRDNKIVFLDTLALGNSERQACMYIAQNDDKLYYVNGKTIYQAKSDFSTQSVFHTFDTDVAISCLFFDRQKNLWVVTVENGIYLFPNRRKSLSFNKNIKEIRVLENELEMVSIYEKSIVWQDQNGVVSTYPISLSSNAWLINLVEEQGSIFTLFYDPTKDKHALYKLNKKTKQFYRQALGLNLGAIKDFDVYNSTMVVASGNGTHLSRGDGFRRLNFDRTTSIQRGPNQNVFYIGTLGGVLKRTMQNGKWSSEQLHSQLDRHVIDLKLDKSGVLWILEQNRIKAYYKGDILANINASNGLVGKTINEISLGENKLVVSTNSGVSVLHYKVANDSLQIGAIDNYSKENGLFSDFNSYAAVFKDKLIVQSKNGISAHGLIQQSGTKKYAPKIIEFRANDRKMHFDSLKLDHKQNYISIDFASLLYGYQPLNYLYRLKEQGEHWQKTTARTCDFLGLPPGEYTFQLKASYNMDKDFGAVSELKFCIEPAFWQTIWFKILVGILFFIILLYPLYVYLSKRKMALESERSLAQLKMQAVKAQMNPHFIFNSLNSIQSIVNNGDIKLANEYIVKFSLLIRKTLNYATIDYITLKDEVGFLHNYIQLEQLRFENSFDYTIEVAQDLNISNTLLPPMMLQIYIENAIKHGVRSLKKGGLVKVLFESENDFLKCIIEDNGVGRELKKGNENKVFSSRGTKLNSDRADIYNAINEKGILINWIDKKDSQGEPKGTIVEIKIPNE